MSEKTGFTAADEAFLRNLGIDQDAEERLNSCYHESTVLFEQGLEYGTNDHRTLTDLFIERATDRIYMLEESDDPRDNALGRTMAAKLHLWQPK